MATTNKTLTIRETAQALNYNKVKEIFEKVEPRRLEKVKKQQRLASEAAAAKKAAAEKAAAEKKAKAKKEEQEPSWWNAQHEHYNYDPPEPVEAPKPEPSPEPEPVPEPASTPARPAAPALQPKRKMPRI